MRQDIKSRIEDLRDEAIANKLQVEDARQIAQAIRVAERYEAVGNYDQAHATLAAAEQDLETAPHGNRWHPSMGYLEDRAGDLHLSTNGGKHHGDCPCTEMAERIRKAAQR